MLKFSIRACDEHGDDDNDDVNDNDDNDNDDDSYAIHPGFRVQMITIVRRQACFLRMHQNHL